MKTITLMFLSANMLSIGLYANADVSKCFENLTNSKDCKRVECPGKLSPYLGFWTSPKNESEVLFSKNACIQDLKSGEVAVVGRQTVSVAANEFAGKRSESKVLIVSDNDFSVVNSRGEVSHEKIENLRLNNTGQKRTLQISKSDTAGLQGLIHDFQFSKAGLTTYYKGTLLVMDGIGHLRDSQSVIMKRVYDPIASKVSEFMVVTDATLKSVQETVLNVYDVTNEVVTRTEVTRNASRLESDGDFIHLFELSTDKNTFQEERLLSSTGAIKAVTFKKGSEISKQEYDQQLQLHTQSTQMRLPSSIK